MDIYNNEILIHGEIISLTTLKTHVYVRLMDMLSKSSKVALKQLTIPYWYAYPESEVKDQINFIEASKQS